MRVLVASFYSHFNCGERRNSQLYAHVRRGGLRANYENHKERQSGRDRKAWFAAAGLMTVACSYCKVPQLAISVSLSLSSICALCGQLERGLWGSVEISCVLMFPGHAV